MHRHFSAGRRARLRASVTRVLESRTGAVVDAKKLGCREMLGDLLADYHDGLLPTDTLAEVEGHMSVCRTCMNMARSYSATTRMAKEALWTETPEHCEKRLLEYLRKHGVL